jgi:hypothetical protein
MKVSKKKILIILFFLITCFFLNFFQNMYNLVVMNYDQRMVKTYGDNSEQGYGFISRVKQNYKLYNNFFYYNYDSAQPHWLKRLNPTYIYKLNNYLKILKDKSIEYLIIIDEPYDQIQPFIIETDFKVLIREDNSYLIKIL